MKTSELLQKAKSLIAKPEKWTQGHYARGHRNSVTELPYGVPVESDAACSFCALGALKRVASETGEEPYTATGLLDSVAFEKYGHCTITVNDSKDHKTIMELYDEAIWRALLDEGNVLPINHPQGESK